MRGVTEWVRQRGPDLAQRLGLSRARMPCQTTSSTVLARVNGQHLAALLRAWFIRWEAQARGGAEPSRLQTPQGPADHRHLALDAMHTRATTSQPHPVHQLRCEAVATGSVRWQGTVGQKEQAISALHPLLPAEDVTGRLLTLDAMHTRAGAVRSRPAAGRSRHPPRQGQPPHCASGPCRCAGSPPAGSTPLARSADRGQRAWTTGTANTPCQPRSQGLVWQAMGRH